METLILIQNSQMQAHRTPCRIGVSESGWAPVSLSEGLWPGV